MSVSSVDSRISFGAPEGAIFLQEGEELCVCPGKMQASKNIEMLTEYATGMLESVKRFFFGGPSYFNNRFQANPGGGWILLEEQIPGQLTAMEVTADKGMKIRRDRWVASTPNIDLQTTYDGLSGLIRGTGIAMINTAMKGDAQKGKIYFAADEGILKKIEVNPEGGPITVDNDSIVAYTNGLTCSFRSAGSGVKSIFFGGEGIVCDFFGKGTIYIASAPQDQRPAPQVQYVSRDPLPTY